MINRLMRFIDFRRSQATDLLLFKTGVHSVRGILLTSIIAGMANAPIKTPMAKWVEFDENKHPEKPFFSAYHAGLKSRVGRVWLEPTKRGKFWMIVVLLTGMKKDD